MIPSDAVGPVKSSLLCANYSHPLALPEYGTEVLSSLHYGMSLWGQAAKIETRVPSGQRQDYLLKVHFHSNPRYEFI